MSSKLVREGKKKNQEVCIVKSAENQGELELKMSLNLEMWKLPVTSAF